MFKEHVILGITVTGWTVFIFVLFGGLIFGGLLLTPTFHNLWIKQFRSSNEYVTTKQTLLFRLVNEYEKLEAQITELETTTGNEKYISAKRGQQQVLLDRINNEASLLQTDQVPHKVKQFLSSH